MKPYIPYDVIPSDYVLPMARNQNGDMLPIRKLHVPDWVVDTDIPLLPIHIPQLELDVLTHAIHRKKLKFCKELNEAVELITQVLRQDIRGVQQGRGQTISSADNQSKDRTEDSTADSLFQCRLDAMNISFVTTSEGIHIKKIEIV